MINDYFRVNGAHDTVVDYADLFTFTLRDDNVQEFDTRCDEVLLSLSKIPSDDILESLYKLRIPESEQLKKSLRIVRDGDASKDIDAQLSNNEDDGEKKYRSETPIAKLWRQTRENRNRSSGQESKGLKWRWKRKRFVLPEERKRLVFEGAVSGMRVMIVHHNRHRKPLHPLSHQWHEVEVRREKEASEAEVRQAKFFDNRADTIWRVLVRDHFASIGIFPNVNSFKLNRDAKQGTTICSRTYKVEEQPRKKPKKSLQNGNSDDKGACSYCENCTKVGLCLARRRAIRT